MSAPINIEKKGIFHWKRATTPNSSPSSSRPASRPVSQPASRQTSPPSRSRALSPMDLPAAVTSEGNVKKLKRSTSDGTLLAGRASRSHAQRHLEQAKILNEIPTIPNVNMANKRNELTYADKRTEPMEMPSKKAESIDDLGSPFKKVSELIESLDLTLDCSTLKSINKDKHIGDSADVGGFVSARESIESIETNDSDFSTPRESPLPHDSTQLLLKQIEIYIQKYVANNNDVRNILNLLAQLSELIANTEQNYKRRLKSMKDIQDNSFAELFLEKNNEINELRLNVEMLKQENSKEIAKLKSSDELMATKNELSRLKEILAVRNNEVNQLTYKLIDAQSYIESLEKQKYAKIKMNADDEDIRNDFKTLKKALMSNRTLLKLMQTKKLNYEKDI